ncbi:MAG: Flp pilus assembly pilin Flp [Lysobacterales bacterium]|jgi:Flp pilus assembly pilin Flp
MLQIRKAKNGQAVIEYIMLIIVIIGALIIFQKYIVRAISGRWKSSGDGIGFGRLYDPKETWSCKFDYVYTNTWYDEGCFDRIQCHCNKLTSTNATCQHCISSLCQSDACDR